MADIIHIGIAYDTSQLVSGSRQVQSAMQQLTQAEHQAETASEQLASSSTKTAQAIGQEGRAASSTASSVSQLGQAAATAGRQVGTLGSSMQSFGQQVGAFALAQVGVQALQQAFATAQAALSDLVRTGTQMAQLRSSFTAISGSAAAGSREFQFAVTTANRLGLELNTVAESYRSLTAATRGTALAGADTRNLFVALANAAQAYGLSTEQLGRASTALQQIVSKGKVSMEELRGQLGEAIPGAMQIAARAFGTTTAALEDLIGKGLDATTFVRKFTAQLASETPQAAERAGKGIAQFGNEILLLKDRIAQSGLLLWLDSAAAKIATLLRASRELSEAQKETTQREAAGTLGPGIKMEALPTEERQKLLDLTQRIADAEADLATKLKAQSSDTFLGIRTQTGAARDRLAALKEEQAALARTASGRAGQASAEANRQRELNEPYVERKGVIDATTTANKALTDGLKGQQKAQDALNKSAALAPELYGKLSGTLKEQNVFFQERLKLNRKALEETTEALVARSAKAEAPPADLLAKHAALRKAVDDDTAAIERNKDAISEAEKARTKAIADAKAAQEKAERERKQAQEEAARLDKQQAEEVARTHFQSFQQLTRLSAQYSEVKAARDEDTASMLAASLATSQYAERSKELLAVIQDIQKVEAKLPALRSEAKTSAAALDDITRLEKQLEPRRRDMSRAEQLAATRAELARVTPEESRGEVLARADAKIKEALDTEAWQTWRDFAEESLDHVGDAITQFAFHGKLTFKDMVTSIAEDFFQMSLKMLTQSALSGVAGGTGGGGSGWLDLALKAGTSLLSAFGGGGAPMEGQAGFIGPPRRQGGGPVSAGHPYVVGENGPELMVPRMNGTILPHGQGLGGTTIVNNFHIQTPDATSFVQSRGAIQRAIASSVSQSYRAL